MRLYHGTDTNSAYFIKAKIDLSKSRKNVDFGPGFYTTPSYNSAKDWAMAKTYGTHKRPAVVVLEFDLDNAQHLIYNFEPNLSWGRFVMNNRNGPKYIGQMSFKLNNLDRHIPITYGMIADYKTAIIAKELDKTKSELQQEGLNKILNNNFAQQYVFHQEYALTFLTVKEIIVL